jgi:hypothetical protein
MLFCMATVTFDTLKFVERLKAAGIPEGQARAMVEAQAEALAESSVNVLATKSDVSRIELKLAEHDGEFRLLKWMIGILLAGVASLVLKAFFTL